MCEDIGIAIGHHSNWKVRTNRDVVMLLLHGTRSSSPLIGNGLGTGIRSYSKPKNGRSRRSGISMIISDKRCVVLFLMRIIGSTKNKIAVIGD